MSNRRIKLLKNKVIDFIKSEAFKEWTLHISRKAFYDGATHYAEVDLETKRIIVNPYKEFIHFLPCVVHEVLHILHPRSHESTVKRWDDEVNADLSPSEKTDLLVAIFTNGRVIWDE